MDNLIDYINIKIGDKPKRNISQKRTNIKKSIKKAKKNTKKNSRKNKPTTKYRDLFVKKVPSRTKKVAPWLDYK